MPNLFLAETSLVELMFRGDNGHTTMMILMLAVGLILSLATIISKTLLKIRRDTNATALKQDMLDRGMTAAEIKTILEAGNSGNAGK